MCEKIERVKWKIDSQLTAMIAFAVIFLATAFVADESQAAIAQSTWLQTGTQEIGIYALTGNKERVPLRFEATVRRTIEEKLYGRFKLQEVSSLTTNGELMENATDSGVKFLRTTTFTLDGSAYNYHLDSSKGTHNCNGEEIEGFTQSSAYGFWLITSYSDKDHDTKLYFCPDIEKIYTMNTGDSARLEFRIGYDFHEGWYVFRKWKNKGNTKVYVNIYRNSDLALTWDYNSSDTSTRHVDQHSTSEGMKATISNTIPLGVDVFYEGDEVHTDSTGASSRIEGQIGDARAVIETPEYSGLENPFGGNFKYGVWVLEQNYRRLTFMPNSTELGKLEPGESVTSTLKMIWKENINNYSPDNYRKQHIVAEMKEISVTFHGPRTLSISNPSVLERNIGDPNPTIGFEVTVSAAQSFDFTVSYYFEHISTESDDFLGGVPSASHPGILHFRTNHGAGDSDAERTRTTESTAPLTLANDALNEGDETFRIVLTGTTIPGIEIATSPSPSHTATGTIRNDDYAYLEFQESDRDQSQTVSDGAFSFNIRVVDAAGIPVPTGVPVPFEVSWLFNNRVTVPSGFSRAGGNDFGDNLNRSAVQFAVGENSKSITVPIKVDDDTYDEVFGIRLHQIRGSADLGGADIGSYVKFSATDANRHATASILVQKVSLTKANPQLSAIDEGGSFAVRLTAVPALTGENTISVSTLALSAGSFAGTFSAGTQDTSDVTLDSSNSSQTVTVTAVNDSFYSNGGTLTVNLAASSGNYGIVNGSSSVDVSVSEEEPVPAISLSKTAESVKEGASFVLILTADPPVGGGHEISVDTLSISGTGFDGTFDAAYRANGAPIAGANATVEVTATDDDLLDNGGALTVSITAGIGYSAGTPSTLEITVIDNDKPELTWDTGSTGYVNVTSNGTYSPMYATFVKDTSVTGDTSSASQKIGTQTAADMEKGTPETHFPNGNSRWNQATRKFGTVSHYGNWYETGESDCNGKTCRYYRFEPNDLVINSLPDGSSVTIALKVRSSGMDIALEVQIARRVSVSLTKSGNVTSVSEGGSFVVTLSAPDLPAGGTVRITTLAVGSEGFNGTLSAGTSGTSPVTLTSASNSQEVTVTAVDDEVYSNGGMLTVNLTGGGSGFHVDSSNSTVSVAVTDNESIPAISLSAELPGSATEISEGDTFTLKLTADPPVGGGHAITLDTLSLTPASLPGSVSSGDLTTASIEMVGETASIMVTATDNDFYSNGGNVIVSVADGNGYAAATSPGNSTSVPVTEGESVPTVSLTAELPDSVTEIAEGGTFTLDLTANPPIGGGYTITVDTLALAPTSLPASVSSGDLTTASVEMDGETASIMVTTTDNDFYSNGGDVIVSIADGIGYNAAASPGNTASVSVSEGETIPTISLTADLPGSVTEIAEGGTFTLNLTASPPVGGGHEITVNTLSLSPTSLPGRVTTGDLTTASVEMNGETASITVTATDNDFYSNGGNVIASIADGIGYAAAASPGNTASVAVTEGESIPAISLSLPETLASVDEGTSFPLTLTATPPVGGGHEITVDTLATAGFAATITQVLPDGTNANTVSMSSGTATISVATASTNTPNNGSVLTVSIAGKPGHYAEGYPNSVSVTVVESSLTQKVSLTLQDKELTEIAEGATFVVVLTAVPELEGADTISIRSLSVADDGFAGTFSAGTEDSPLELSSTVQSGTVTVEATDDIFYSNGGTLTVNLGEGSGYKALESSKSVSIDVTDDESQPLISLSAPDEPVTEGSPFMLILTADPAVASSHAITVDTLSIATTGFQGSISEGTAVTPLLMTGSTMEVMVKTEDNQYYSKGGTLTVSFANGTDYMAGESSLDVPVVDDEDKPEVTLLVPDVPVAEGSTFNVTLTALPNPGGEFELPVDGLTVSASGHPGTISTETPMIDSSGSVLVEITATDDHVHSDGGTLILELADGAEYTAGSENTARVTVVENDPVPSISFKRNQFCSLEPNSGGTHLQCEISKSQGTLPVFLSMSHGSAKPVSVSTATRAPLATELADFPSDVAAAAAGTDFLIMNAEKTFNPGTVELNSPIKIMDNSVSNGNKGFLIEFRLAEAADAVFAGEVESLTAMVTITDETDSAILPMVSVVADRQKINEGEPARFNFSSDTDLKNVAISIEQQGEYVIWPVRNRVNIVDGTATLKIDTIDNSIDGEDGRITVRILYGAHYDPDPVKSIAHVEVRDTGIESKQLYSVAGNVINIILSAESNESSPPLNHGSPSVPEISISALESRINEGSKARFRVESSIPVKQPLSVNLRISRIGITGGNSTDSVDMEEGEQSVSLELETRDDGLGGSDGRLTATVVEREGYRVGPNSSASVAVSDEPDRLTGLNLAVLPEIAASVGTRTLDATGNRMAQAFSGTPQTRLELAGGSSATDMLRVGGLMMNVDEIDWNSLLGSSSFSLALYPDGSETSSATVWAVGDDRELSGNGRGGTDSWDGDVLTGHLGFDAIVGQGMLAGLAASATQAEVEFEGIGESETRLGIQTTGIHPYFGLETADGGTQVRMTAGYGVSELDIDSNRHSTNILNGDFSTIGAEGSSRLHASDDLLYGGRSELDAVGEFWMTRQRLDVDSSNTAPLRTFASHVRMAVEGAHTRTLAPGHKVTPSVSFGMRRDDRDSLATYGYEIGSGVNYSAAHGFSAEASGLAVMSALNLVHEWELLGSMDYDAGNDGLGVLASMQSAWGGTGADERNFLWKSDILDVSDSSGVGSNGARIESEVGYGFALMNGEGKVYPYGGGSITEVNSNEVRLGSRFNVGRNISFEIEGSEGFGSSEDNSRNFLLNGNVSW